MKERMRRRIIQWFWFTPDKMLDHEFMNAHKWEWVFTSMDWVKERIAPVLCWWVGSHEVTSECSRPEHDYCIWCQKSLPGQFNRPTTHP